MPRALSENTIPLIKATIPALEARGLDIVHEMYSKMFQNPEIRDLFNQSHHGTAGSQPRALATAILAYASNIDNLGVLTHAVERIAQKHVGLQILPQHYPHVGDALLGAIKTVLGDAATKEILDAWGEAYWYLADILIERESSIYQELATAEGGWKGWRPFVVEDVRPESEVITSFVLRPDDGAPVIRHKPGQYLSFWLDIPGQPPVKRNYSISSAPNGQWYRISVKREPMGLASGWLHNNAKPGTVLKVAPPAGEFFLPDQTERPVVLMSGGVGLTPMVSMLETLAERATSPLVHYVHGCLDRTTHAMHSHVKRIAGALQNFKVTNFHEAPRDGEVRGHDYDEAGLITIDWLKRNTPIENADYYLCGPRPFLRNFVAGLVETGVPANRIHYEFFGPADEILAA